MIETDRLLLRPPASSDLAWMTTQLNTPVVTRHLGGVRTAAQVEAGFVRNAEGIAKGEPGFWTIVVKDGEAIAGKCGLAAINSDHAPAELQGHLQIGWSLGEQFWGKGLATEAARAVLGYAFGPLGAAVVYSQTSDSNAASTRMMARLGFQRRADLDYTDPDYPAADNPTTIYQAERGL
jgi:RimJ/RimL family protein N-acetyltransferase